MISPGVLALAAIFLLVLLSLWSLSNLSDFNEYGPVIAKEEETSSWGENLWPLGVLILAIFYSRESLYNPKAIFILVLSFLVLISVQAVTRGREVVQTLFVLGAIAALAHLAPKSPLLQYAIPLVFILAGISFVLFYFEQFMLMRILLGVALVAIATVTCPPRNFADSAALFIATGLFVK